MGSTLFFWCVFCVLRGQQRRGGLDPFHPGAATSLCLPDRFSIYYVLLAKNSWEEQKMETDRFSLDVTAMMAAAAQKRRKGGSIIDPTPRERRAKWESSSRQPSSLASPVQRSPAKVLFARPSSSLLDVARCPPGRAFPKSSEPWQQHIVNELKDSFLSSNY